MSNHWLYNCYLPLQVFFSVWFIYKTFPLAKLPGWIAVCICLLFTGFVLWESLEKSFQVYNAWSDTVATFLLIVLCGCYYYFLMKMDDGVDIMRNAGFWFVSGVFLFQFGSMVPLLFSEELMQLYVIGHISLRFLIYLFLNMVLYACWTYAFKCKYHETISLSA